MEVWVSISTGKSFRIGHEMARDLGPEKAQALPMFDVLTAATRSSDSLTWTEDSMDSVDSSTRGDQTLTLLSTAPDHIDEDAMHAKLHTNCFTTEQAP